MDINVYKCAYVATLTVVTAIVFTYGIWDYEGVVFSSVQFIKAASYQAHLQVQVACSVQEKLK